MNSNRSDHASLCTLPQHSALSLVALIAAVSAIMKIMLGATACTHAMRSQPILKPDLLLRNYRPRACR